MRNKLPVTSKQLVSASGLALATALIATAPSLRAQSFQGTPVSTFGDVSISATGSATDITISSPSAVINWVPNDTAPTGGAINFQPNGTTATFTNNPDLTSDFAVLNRIVPSGSTRPIQFNGNVISRLQTVAGQVAGGTVFFYSPGGILIGNSGVFDVGNLVLTTSDLNYDASGSFGSGGTYEFLPATVAGAKVNISGAVTATTDGSYVAVVAPAIESFGPVDVNGSVAFVAADAARITFAPSGLFDIEVTSGSSAAAPTPAIAAFGSIGGPAASDPTFLHRVYMVTVPKNDALTMVIGAGTTLGFDIAGAADVVGNAIVLSGGHDIAGGTIQSAPSAGGGTGTVSIGGQDFAATSNFIASSTGTAYFGSASNTGLSFAADAALTGANGQSGLFATPGGIVSVVGNLSVDSSTFGTDPATEARGWTSSLVSDGGTISIGGRVNLLADGIGAPALVAGIGSGSGTGGEARIQATNGGSISIAGDVLLQAVGQGGFPEVADSPGGFGMGGATRLLSTSNLGSSVSVGGNVVMNSSGNGGVGSIGGAGYGSSASITASGNSTLQVAGSTSIFSQGRGGSGTTTGGEGRGGSLAVVASNDAALTLHGTSAYLDGEGGGGDTQTGATTGGNALISANGLSQAGAGGGPGTSVLGINGPLYVSVEAFDTETIASIASVASGGTALIEAASGNKVNIAGDVIVAANARGNAGSSAVNAVTAGVIELRGTTGGELTVSGGVDLQAPGTGGRGSATAAGGNASGGVVRLTADAGKLSLAAVSINAIGVGGVQESTGQAGRGQGGSAVIASRNGGDLALSSTLNVNANGLGGFTLDAGQGGAGIGGAIQISTAAGSGANLGSNIILSASGQGGDGEGTLTGGQGRGGDISLRAFGPGTGSGLSLGGSVSLVADGTGGTGGTGAATNGVGGEGIGGTLAVLADGADLTVSGSLILQSVVNGGNSGLNAGAGFGGSSSVEARNGGRIAAGSNISLDMQTSGGVSAVSGTGGAATGANLLVAANGGTVQSGDGLFLIARSLGGGTSAGTANGGAASGRFITLTTSGTGQITAATNITLIGRADGGASFGGTGGLGQGSAMRLNFGGGQVSAPSLTIDAFGVGGSGSAGGGVGQGGSVIGNVSATTIAIGESTSIVASGAGGAGLGNSAAGTGAGGTIALDFTRSTFDFGSTGGASLEASGFGGQGAAAQGTGGNVSISASASTLRTTAGLQLVADGGGSAARNGASGGFGKGGAISVSAFGNPQGSSTITAGTLVLRASGFGGTGSRSLVAGVDSGVGGGAEGGSIALNAAVDGGTIAATEFFANATALAGDGGAGFRNPDNGLGSGGQGGAAKGGTVTLGSFAASGGSGTGGYTFGSALADASARGGFGGDGDDGFVPGQAGNGGNALGGAIQMQFDQGGSRIDVAEGLTLFADATGGSSGFCAPGCIGAGGLATGGTITFGSGGVTAGNRITLGSLTLTAQALGGGSFSPSGGAATGGGAFFRIGSGTAFSANAVEIVTDAHGGDQFTNGTGGAATGGTASFIASGTSTASVAGAINLSSSGIGGNGRDTGASGGAGTGGVSRLYSDGGTIAITGGANIDASGFGGAGDQNSAGGIGGVGTGGSALLTVGTPTALGNGGNITVGGFTFVVAQGSGGDAGQGGLGVGGFTGVSARQGNLTLDQLYAGASAFGGYGQFGGAGGEAQGGAIEIFANSAVEGASRVTINALSADASASGGFGGDAPATGGLGGTGGLATGGAVAIFGTAGNGTMQIGTVNAGSIGHGGGGGAGSTGGAGGTGAGGSVQIGTASGFDTGTLNAGSATYGTITALASGVGGAGGEGDAASGTGGAGGNAMGGGSLLLVRGSPVTITGNGAFIATAEGGTGGAGSVQGSGGNAEFAAKSNPTQILGAELLVTSRFQQAAQRGSLNAIGDLTFDATAVGGAGSTPGTATLHSEGVEMQVINGTVNAGNIFFNAHADLVDPLAPSAVISLTNATATFSGGFAFRTPGSLSLGLDQSTLTAEAVSISAGNFVLPSTVPTSIGTLTGTSELSLTSGRDLVGYANLSTQGSLTLQSLGRIEFGSLFALGAIDVAAGNTLSLGNVQSGDEIDLTAQGAIVTGNLTAATAISVEAGGDITLGNLATGTGTPSGATPALHTVGIRSAGNIRTGSIFAASDIGIAAAGSLTTGGLRGFDALLLAGGNVTIDSLSMVNRTLVANVAMAALGETDTGFDKERVFGAPVVATGGAVSLTNSSTVGALRIAAGTTVTTGNVFGNGPIGVTGDGALTFGIVNAGAGRLELFSRSGGITAANLLSGQDILASGATGLSLGQVRGRDVALLSGGNINVQSVLAGAVFDPQTNQITNAVGRLLIGNATMLAATTTPGTVDYAALFAKPVVRAGGNATIGSGAIFGRLFAATSGSFAGGGLRGFSGIEVEAGGLVTVGQRWGAPEVRIVSSDLAIIDNGTATNTTGQPILSGIRTTETGFVDLISNSGGTALIGDGLSGTGYALSNVELSLISTGELLIAAVDQSANATDMLIGNLSLTSGGAIGSSIAAGSTGRIIFASGNLQTQTPGGAIRVVGTINGTGFGQSNVVEFTTGRFELDAAAGAINLTSAAQPGIAAPLGGVVEINAANIHVASAAILDKLAADPLYAGRIAELNAPAAVQRPGGVLRALGLDLFPTGTLYIQNTGTVLNPAGFFADRDFVDVTAPNGAAAGSLSVVVNGAFQTPTGTVSGIPAHDLVVGDPEADFRAFSPDSQINGCGFNVTACTPTVVVSEPIASISSQISIISTQSLGSTPTFVEEPTTTGGDPESDDPGQEEQQQEQASEGEEAASSPIAPPPQLIDSRPLEPAAQIEQPVSGSGNPAFIGSVVNENSAQGDEQ